MIFTAGMINTPTWARIPWTGRERSIHTHTHIYQDQKQMLSGRWITVSFNESGRLSLKLLNQANLHLNQTKTKEVKLRQTLKPV